MAINSSIQQISGGIASGVAGLIVFQAPAGKIERYPLLGGVVIVTMIITIFSMYWIDQHIQKTSAAREEVAPELQSV